MFFNQKHSVFEIPSLFWTSYSRRPCLWGPFCKAPPTFVCRYDRGVLGSLRCVEPAWHRRAGGCYCDLRHQFQKIVVQCSRQPKASRSRLRRAWVTCVHMIACLLPLVTQCFLVSAQKLKSIVAFCCKSVFFIFLGGGESGHFLFFLASLKKIITKTFKKHCLVS